MYDPYRERLVMETQTRWDPDCPPLDAAARTRVGLLLHEDPASATALEYLRTHTGFCRTITITPADLARLGYH